MQYVLQLQHFFCSNAIPQRGLQSFQIKMIAQNVLVTTFFHQSK